MVQEKPSNPYHRKYTGAGAWAGALVQCDPQMGQTEASVNTHLKITPIHSSETPPSV